MDGIKFFRFQNEANPRIWAAGRPAGTSSPTGVAYGSYTSDPTIGTKVTLTGSGALTGLKHTFEVKQWDTTNKNWGAAIYKGTADKLDGTRTLSATDAARRARTFPDRCGMVNASRSPRCAAARRVSSGQVCNHRAFRHQLLCRNRGGDGPVTSL